MTGAINNKCNYIKLTLSTVNHKNFMSFKFSFKNS